MFVNTNTKYMEDDYIIRNKFRSKVDLRSPKETSTLA